MAMAKGGLVPSGGRVWRGVSPLHPTRGSGERRELPSGVRGGAPAENGFWRILKATERSFLYLYDKICWRQFALSSPFSKFWGTCPPVPPVIYAHVQYMLEMSVCPAADVMARRSTPEGAGSRKASVAEAVVCVKEHIILSDADRS